MTWSEALRELVFPTHPALVLWYFVTGIVSGWIFGGWLRGRRK